MLSMEIPAIDPDRNAQPQRLTRATKLLQIIEGQLSGISNDHRQRTRFVAERINLLRHLGNTDVKLVDPALNEYAGETEGE